MGGCGSVDVDLANIYPNVANNVNGVDAAEEEHYNNLSNPNFKSAALLSQQVEAPPKDTLGILKHARNTASNLMLTIKHYKGDDISTIIQVGRNESNWQPKRNLNGINRTEQMLEIFSGQKGLKNIICVIQHFINRSNIDLNHLTRRNLFPNDVIALIILFSIIDHPKVEAFQALVPTALICLNIPITCQYIGQQLSSKILQEFSAQIDNANEITTSKVISEDNAQLCRELIILFDIILGLDEYKMKQQRYLVNNFTAYKRMHGDFLNAQSAAKNAKNGAKGGGGGFAAFQAAKRAKKAAAAEAAANSNSNNNSNTNNNNNETTKESGEEEKNEETDENLAAQFTNDEIIPVATVSDISMFMGLGSTACIDKISDSMVTDMQAIQNALLAELSNGCLLLLKFNANSKDNRNMQIVKHALTIMRAMCALLLILDRQKTLQNNYQSVFGNNERSVKSYDCCRVFTQHFVQWYGDEESIGHMIGVNNRRQLELQCKYCKQIIKLNSAGFRAGREFIKNKIYSLLE